MSQKIFQNQCNKIEKKEAVIGVIGLGYVGLPLARLFAEEGFRVIGFDVDKQKIEILKRGESYISYVPSAAIKALLKQKNLTATWDFRKLRISDVIIICVPTPLTLDKRPDLSYIKSTAQVIAKNLRKGQLVVLESTTYPFSTREILLPELSKTGLVCGKDFFLAFSPEREDPGNPKFSTKDIPKVVGGIDKNSLELAKKIYSKIVTIVPVSSCEVAEASKILENTYRCINIALVNELKMVFDKMGINIWEVISAASTKPFGFQTFYPGPGMGGHCIPVDPFYLSWKAKEYDIQARFIELAGEINIQMPFYVVNGLIKALKTRGKKIVNSNILILGLAYKKDTNDPRESPSFKIIELLLEKGAKIKYNDPYILTFPRMRHYNFKIPFVKLTKNILSKQDAVIISTDHSIYNYDFIFNNSNLIIDPRNAIKKIDNKIIK